MISSPLYEIFERLREENSQPLSYGPTVSVHKLTSRAGAFYEKIRYLVEYKDEHTIRRSAIERMLKRKFSLEGEESVGMPLLLELVSAEYLPNNQVPETVARDIQNVVDKYRLLGAKIGKRWTVRRSGKVFEIDATVLSLMASEIDRMLFPHELDDAIAESFYKTMKESIRCTPSVPEEDLRAPLYIACRRSLLGDDPATLLFVLVSKYVPELEYVQDVEEVKALAPALAEALTKAQRELNDPFIFRVAAAIRNRALGFSVVREVIKKHGFNAENIFEVPELLESETKQILAERYIRLNHSVWVSGIHAAIYILLTKSIFTFLLEIPYELYLYQSVDVFALGVNIIFHPILLLLMVYTIHPLDSENMLRTLKEVRGVVSNEGEESIHIRQPKKGLALLFVLGVLYAVLFTATFGAIIKVLLWARFSSVSIALFLFFLALVSYFGLRIRYNAGRWKVSSPNENIVSLLWNFFTLPIIRAGRFLSRKFAAINVFVFVMDFVIETPFKIMLGTFDSFLSFLKEKEEDSMY
jgi:hypothetical protein